MMRTLVDGNMVSLSGNRIETYVEYPEEQPSQTSIGDAATLAIELSFAPIKGVKGYRLVQEEILPDNSRKVFQEFIFAPDIAFALFKHWERAFQED